MDKRCDECGAVLGMKHMSGCSADELFAARQAAFSEALRAEGLRPPSASPPVEAVSSAGGRKVRVVPLTFPKANECVSMWHRHHAPLPGGFAWYCLGAVVDGTVRASAICGRPTNRNNDDGQTVEVIRLASDGSPNVCSALYGAAVRVAREMGAARIITYTLDSESGSSLRAAGWNRDKDGITSWWTHKGSRTPAVERPHMQERKVRWSVEIRPSVSYALPASTVDGAPPTDLTLFPAEDGTPDDASAVNTPLEPEHRATINELFGPPRPGDPLPETWKPVFSGL